MNYILIKWFHLLKKYDCLAFKSIISLAFYRAYALTQNEGNWSFIHCKFDYHVLGLNIVNEYELIVNNLGIEDLFSAKIQCQTCNFT